MWMMLKGTMWFLGGFSSSASGEGWVGGGRKRPHPQFLGQSPISASLLPFFAA